MIRLPGILLLLGFGQPVWAAGPPGPSAFDNPLAVTLMVLMALLLIIIGILANVLLGAADIKVKKEKKSSAAPVITSMLILLLLSSGSLFAQNGAANTQPTAATADTIGGMSASTFYIMATVIFLELAIILVMLINIKLLLKVEKEKVEAAAAIQIQTAEDRKSRLSWWDKFNLLRPVTQESELDLGHDYDGIRELNNRLPPWWLYGFYLTIIVACIYLWRYHVSHTAPLSREEFEISVANGDREVAQYLKMKGENVDENNVTLLRGAEDIDAGKAIFLNPQNCVTCHRADAGGNVGPNLTDDYWIYGGSIRDLFKTIKYGTNKGMRSWKDDLSAKQMAQVASYIKSLHGTNPPNPKERQGELYKEESIVKPSADSIKVLNDSIKAKDNKVVMN